MEQASRCVYNLLAVLATVSAACVFAGCVPVVSQLPPHPGMTRATPTSDRGVEVKWFTLQNGLTVAMIPDPHANLVSVAVRYRVGSAEDPRGKPGLAHLVEHMTYAQHLEPDGPTLADRLQLATLDRNGYTTADATHFYAVAPASQLDPLLALEAARLDRGCRGIDQATFDRERAIVALEIGQRRRSGAAAIPTELFGRDHPYVHGPGGDPSGLTLADVCGFLDAYYAPDRAVLLIGGRFDPAALPAAVTARFGPLRHRATGALARVAVPSMATRTSELRAPIAKPNAVIVLPAAPWGSSDALDDALLDDLVAWRLEAIAARKPWILRVDHGRLGGGRAAVRYISIVVDDPARLDDASALVFDQASAIRASAGSLASVPDLLERRRNALLDRFESFLGRTQLCADALQFSGDRRCRLPELRAMETERTAQVATRAKKLAEGPRRVIRILPAGDGDPDELELPAPDAPETEAPVWHSSIDPADADRPLALPAALHTSDVSEFSLDNGLRVVMASNFTQPLVDVRLVFPVGVTGGAQDVVAYAAAKLLRHDFMRRYTADDRATLRWLFDLGTTRYVEVTDSTAFRIRGLAEFTDWHLWRLLWLIREGGYSSRELMLAVEAEAARGRRASNREPDGLARRSQAVREALYGPGHPYAHARDQEISARIAALTVRDLEEFHDRYYAPAGAALIIAGRFDPATMRKKVTELFGGWIGPARRATEAIPAMQPVRGPSWIAYDDRSAAQVRITFDFAATSARAASRAARAVLSEIVRARVERVRTEMLASYGIDAGYWTSLAGDVIRIDGLVSASRSGEVLRRLQADLDELRAGGNSVRSDFVRARRAALAAVLADPSIPSATTRRLQHAIVSHSEITREPLAVAIASTTLRDVARVIAEDLQPTRMVGVLSGRPADTAAALAAAGITGARSIGDPAPGVASSGAGSPPPAASSPKPASPAQGSAPRPAPGPVPPPKSSASLPTTLDRAMIADGLRPIRDQVMNCGATWPRAKGRVKVRVQVAPDGRVVHTAVTQSPHDGLGACVANAIAKARFAATREGGSFSYPWEFAAAPALPRRTALLASDRTSANTPTPRSVTRQPAEYQSGM